MDSKIKEYRVQSTEHRLIYQLCCLLAAAAFAVLLPGCKQNDWMDWKVQNELWLENNKTQAGVVVSSTGLQYKIIADPLANNGEAKPNKTSVITCDYRLQLINGYVVESYGKTFGGTAPVQLDLSSVIPGFQEGCTRVHNQGDIEIYIPAYLGYDYAKYNSNEYSGAEGSGTEGTQSYIPPYSTLIYTIHICGISGD